MNNEVGSLIIIIMCVIISAYFSATETAFSSLNKIRIKTMAEKGNKRANLVMKLCDNYDSLLSTILIGNNIVNIASASIATILFVNWLGNQTGTSASTAVMTITVLIFGEVTPKSIAKEIPETFAMLSAPILNILIVLLTPFNYFFKQWKKLLSKIVKTSDDKGITEEELLCIVDEAQEDGNIDEQENMLIKSALDFTEQEAIDILTPRIDIVAVSTKSTKDEIAQLFSDTGYSRIPIYEESIDHIVGIIYQKDFYTYVYHNDKEIFDIIRPALFVPQNKKIGTLLKELQKKKIHIAIVLDEYSGTIGIITLEDILEELVGEIWDEYDEVNQEIEKKSDTEYIISGNANVEDVFDVLGIEYAEDEIQSYVINGWIMNQLERIPQQNDSFEFKNFNITVLDMDEKRINKVNFKKVI